MLSPNFNDRPDGIDIDTVVIHYTGMKSFDEAFDRLCDKKSEVSAHYLIKEDGEIINLVYDEYRAWHAGVSSWRGSDNVNDYSVGIELVNKGHEFGYEPFPERQMDSLLRLLQELLEKYPIEIRNIVGHSDIAPTRKEDPGELFNWELLASYNFAIWPDLPNDIANKILLSPGDKGEDVKKLQQKLSDFGYKITVDGDYGIETCYVVVAFCRRFTPTNIGDKWHQHADMSLESLLNSFL